MDNWQAIFNVIGLGLASGLGWFGRTLYDRLSVVEKDLAAHKVYTAERYVSYDRLTDALAPIHNALGRIEGKISK